MISVVHLVPRISRGGGTASPLNIARQLQRRESSSHVFVSLAKAEPETARAFEEEAFPIIDAPSHKQLDELLEQVDIVQVNWWNTPEMAAFFARTLPATRLVLWSVVTGDAPPHVISEELLAKVDHFVACTPYSMELPSVKNLSNPRKKEFIHIPANFNRLSNLRKKDHEGFNIGYIGTIDYAKMHRDYLAMCKSLDIPDARFLVCGQGRSLGELKDQSIKEGMKNRFRFFGYIEDIAEVISEMDVYGYPLNENTFAAAELNLQEVMWAGLPIVSSPYGGVPHLIHHEETGLLVNNKEDYRQAVEHLYHNPQERFRLGQNAAEYARKNFAPGISADRFENLYKKILDRPKTIKSPIHENLSSTNISTDISGAKLLIQSIGDFAKPLCSSMESMHNTDALAADKEIAGADELFHQGCIIQFMHAYPTDPWLHLWNGLINWTGRSFTEAHDSWSMAIRYGIERERVLNYLAHVSEMESHPKAQEKLFRVRTLIDESLPAEEKEVCPPWERLLLTQELRIQETLLIEIEQIIKSKSRIIHPELKLSEQIGKALEKSNSRPIFLWGAGVAGQKVKAAMDLLKELPQGFIDRSEKIDDLILGLPVFSPEILEGGESAFVLICTMHYRQVSESLEKFGLNPIEDFLALHIP